MRRIQPLLLTVSLLLLSACGTQLRQNQSSGFEVKVLVGSALEEFCNQSATQFNQGKPTLASGEAFYMSCKAEGSGDVVTTVITLATQFQQGTVPADAPEFPTLLSVDGEIYHDQLIYRMNQLFPGKTYIPAITDAPLLAFSPMVFMTSKDLAPGLRKTDTLFRALVNAKTHRDLDPADPPLAIHYVHTAPSRSNSGLQTLVTQFAEVTGKRPQELTIADVNQAQQQVQQIQAKITRYGVSTSSLAEAMVRNGLFWASIGSVYESSVIEANSQLPAGQVKYEAVYPPATFTSNMRGILPQAPWISAPEKEAAEKILTYLQSPPAQQIATNLGLRPGASGIQLGPKFRAEFGVDPQAKYDSYRPPTPEVVDAMVKSWETVAKKASLVAVVIDSSGSMQGEKLAAVQATLQRYTQTLRSEDKVALIDFDSQIREPVLVDGTPSGQERSITFISNLQVDGGTRLYDAALAARNWLKQNLRPNAINAVLILTDGEDSGSNISLEQLAQELQKSGFSSDDRIAFFTIGYGREGDFNPEALEQIAQFNGGYYKQGDPSTIARLMSDLQLEF
jgi:Ca-activated chloride channel family protein